MKRFTRRQTRSQADAGQARAAQRDSAHRHGGAALIVVISLLGTLMFLGFLFYAFATQEKASAEYFAAAATPLLELPPEPFFDWTLEQLIVGTDASLTNSALFGSKYSLLANMLGTPNRDASSFTFGATTGPDDLSYGNNGGGGFADVQPFDGAGITTVVTGLNTVNSPIEFGFDVDQDGAFAAGSEPDWENFIFNFSPAADAPNGATGPYTFDGTAFSGSTLYRDYEPDAGYTYPDINSPFLAYDALVRGWVDGDNGRPRTYRVIIPSFFRPQLFPLRRGTNDTGTPDASGSNGNGFGDLYTNDQTARQVLRPHQDHVASVGPDIRRYVSTLDPQYNGALGGVQAQSGDRNRIISPFPFRVDLDGDGNFNEMGVWTNPFQGQDDPDFGGQLNYELDVDADGDGIRDAIWMDFDFPLMTLEDGRQFVPMMAVKIIDADSLLNVNAHGNHNGLYVRLQDGSIEVLGPDGLAIAGSTGGGYGVDGLSEIGSFHQSNLGLSPSEVNLSLALTANLRDPSHVDPTAADPTSVLDNDDSIASQFELMWNYGYNVDPALSGSLGTPIYTAAEVRAPSVAALSNLEALMILNGRREFEKLRNGNVRETRQQILGRYGDRFKIMEFYRRLAIGDPDYADGLSDGESIASPLPGGYDVDDDGDSNTPGLSQAFSGMGDDDIDAPGVDENNFRRGGGSFTYDQELYGVQMPPSVHPLDYLGVGHGYLAPSSGTYLTRQIRTGLLTNNPSVWPTYLDQAGMGPFTLWHYQGVAPDNSETDLTGVLPWRLGFNSAATISDPIANPPVNFLQPNNNLYDFLIDEPNEMILEPEYRNPEYDSVFPTYEMEGIHLSASDFSKIKGSSRLRELASVNLERVVDDVRSTISKRLTTESWDRLEPGQTRWQSAASMTFDRLWEYTRWNDGDPSAGDFYAPEDAFPPEFGPAGSRVLAGTTNDPVRPEMRLLLKNERGFSGGMTGDVRYPRRKLNLNRILAGEDSIVPASGDIDRRSFDDDSNPRFRNLVPHPNVTRLLTIGPITAVTIPGMVHNNVGINTQPGIAPSFNDLGLDPTASQTDRQNLIIAQEWWARYDRQRLARDIFVLLYTLGLGNDGFNVAEFAYPMTSDADGNGVDDLVDEMAQFAVNYVDALDHDNVITRFEYDGNLSDGWSWTTGGPAVNGVEAQQLTLSEAIWSRTVDEGSDFARTFWDDDSREHQFLHIELRSTSPFETVLADETWRIVRTDSATGNTQQARVSFQRNPGTQALRVEPGENFTIGSADGRTGLNLDLADFYVDQNNDSTWDCIVPAGSATVSDPAAEDPKTDLDLVASTNKPQVGSTSYTNFSDYYTLNLGTDGNGQTLSNLVGLNLGTATDSTGTFDLVLQRRRHLNAENLLAQNDDALSDNLDSTQSEDWIEVDRIRVTVNGFDPANDNNADIQTSLDGLVSQVRLEPFNAAVDLASTQSTTGSASVNHTIDDLWGVSGSPTENPNRDLANLANPSAGGSRTGPFTLWQPHFDRDFSSVFELFAVPLFGPDETTRRLADTAGTLSGFDKTTGPPLVASWAGRRFTDTDPDDNSGGATPTITDDNRWYRLLEHVEIPSRAEDAIRDRLIRIIRTPGKLNLNTIRHEEILAALIDDAFIERFSALDGRMTDVLFDGNPPSMEIELESLETGSDMFASPRNYSGVRNWMDELRLARDGIDPVNYLPASMTDADRSYIPLPGIPGAPADPADTAAIYSSTNGRPQFGSIPFRGLSYVDPNVSDTLSTNPAVYVDPISRTILRSHVPPIGQGGTNEVINRKNGLEDLGLFEARPTSDVGTNAYDYHTRNRLLAKIANNSTNRSNVFLCWIVVEYFEAHQPLAATNPNIVQVGAKLEGSPTHRGFFVIDRTRLEQAVDLDSVTNPNNNGRDDNFRFDWRDFVIHRRTIQ